MNFITTKEACELLGCAPKTLRKYETEDGRWCTIYGLRFRVYRLGTSRQDQRRYDRDEIIHQLEESKQR